MEKKIVYFDMDGVLADFMSGVYKFPKEMQEEYKDNLDNLPRLFSMLEPVPGAIEAVKTIASKYDVYVLSTVPWSNETGASDKINWIKKYFGDTFKKHVILSHHKELCKGDYLIDDHTRNGAAEFEGEHIHFGTDKFPDWKTVTDYLMNEDNIPYNDEYIQNLILKDIPLAYYHELISNFMKLQIEYMKSPENVYNKNNIRVVIDAINKLENANMLTSDEKLIKEDIEQWIQKKDKFIESLRLIKDENGEQFFKEEFLKEKYGNIDK